jgi:hypothetical protein
MKQKNGVSKFNCGSGFVVILRVFYISGFSPASLMLPALLACFGPPVSAAVLPPGICPLSDPLQHTVMLPHPTDCSSFFKCSNGVPILTHCPAGLHFNEQINVCDWPQNANCVKRKLCSLYVTLEFLFSSNNDSMYQLLTQVHGGSGSSVGITIDYGLDGPGIESRLGLDFSHTSRPGLGPTQPRVE